MQLPRALAIAVAILSPIASAQRPATVAGATANVENLDTSNGKATIEVTNTSRRSLCRSESAVPCGTRFFPLTLSRHSRAGLSHIAATRLERG
jgi:hypothetical protein